MFERRITNIYILVIIFLIIMLSSCKIEKEKVINFEDLNLSLKENENFSTAIFSGGCFWCVESDFEKQKGVVMAISGYTSNNKEDVAPDYEKVSSGETNFRESILVVYDKTKIKYEELLKYFFKIHDQTDENGSFYDRGFQYTSAIYYQNDIEKKTIKRIINETNDNKIFNKKIITSVEELQNFFVAEKYHQDYYKKNPIRYKFYRKGSGRDIFIEEITHEFEKIK